MGVFAVWSRFPRVSQLSAVRRGSRALRAFACQEFRMKSLMLSDPLHLDGDRVDGMLQPRQLSSHRVAYRSRVRLLIDPARGAVPRRPPLRGHQREDSDACEHREHWHESSLSYRSGCGRVRGRVVGAGTYGAQPTLRRLGVHLDILVSRTLERSSVFIHR